MPQLVLYAAIPAFIGSLLSCIATTTFGVLYYFFPPERHFRQALVVNLLLADWINSLNNTISGAIALSRRDRLDYFTPGAACTTNGWVGQFSVQAIDFNILIISIIVLITVRKNHFEFQPTLRRTLAVCAIPWVFPLITSSIVLGLDAYGPVSGNWCWIIASRQDLRWGLTHGWRVAIFIFTVANYTYVYIHLAKSYRNLTVDDSNSTDPELTSQSEHELCRVDTTAEERTSTTKFGKTTSRLEKKAPYNPRVRRTPELRKMLLLNGYPLLYILLWLPGMGNRIHEAATGWSPGWLIAWQGASQFVGLGNALTYAFNEQLRGRIRRKSAV